MIVLNFSNSSCHLPASLPSSKSVRTFSTSEAPAASTGLYVELLKDNSAWGTAERRHEMNHFMARLIFCFFAEDTGIFTEGQFTNAVGSHTQADGSDVDDFLPALFTALDHARDHAFSAT